MQCELPSGKVRNLLESSSLSLSSSDDCVYFARWGALRAVALGSTLRTGTALAATVRLGWAWVRRGRAVSFEFLRLGFTSSFDSDPEESLSLNCEDFFAARPADERILLAGCDEGFLWFLGDSCPEEEPLPDLDDESESESLQIRNLFL